jgi:hypothetical protein
MDITTGTFTVWTEGPHPAENFAFTRDEYDYESELWLFPSGNSVPVGIQLLDLTSNTLSTNDTFTDFLENSPDSAAIDESTNVGVVKEYSGNQYLFNLLRHDCVWKLDLSVHGVPIPLSGSGADMTYVAVDSLSHTLFAARNLDNTRRLSCCSPPLSAALPRQIRPVMFGTSCPTRRIHSRGLVRAIPTQFQSSPASWTGSSTGSSLTILRPGLRKSI